MFYRYRSCHVGIQQVVVRLFSVIVRVSCVIVRVLESWMSFVNNYIGTPGHCSEIYSLCMVKVSLDIKNYKAKKACFLDIAQTDDVFKTLLKHIKIARKNTRWNIDTWDKWVCTYFMKMAWG